MTNAVVFTYTPACVCVLVEGAGVWVGGFQVEGLVGKEDGVKTVIAASKRGLHGFPSHHVPAIIGLHHFHPLVQLFGADQSLWNPYRLKDGGVDPVH